MVSFGGLLEFIGAGGRGDFDASEFEIEGYVGCVGEVGDEIIGLLEEISFGDCRHDDG